MDVREVGEVTRWKQKRSLAFTRLTIIIVSEGRPLHEGCKKSEGSIMVEWVSLCTHYDPAPVCCFLGGACFSFAVGKREAIIAYLAGSRQRGCGMVRTVGPTGVVAPVLAGEKLVPVRARTRGARYHQSVNKTISGVSTVRTWPASHLYTSAVTLNELHTHTVLTS